MSWKTNKRGERRDQTERYVKRQMRAAKWSGRLEGRFEGKCKYGMTVDVCDLNCKFFPWATEEDEFEILKMRGRFRNHAAFDSGRSWKWYYCGKKRYRTLPESRSKMSFLEQVASLKGEDHAVHRVKPETLV